ncbi:monovalent cation:proton antiporter-2 (CPA2) family protein [Paraglaciecola aquimarina]|uniref:Monovalent cation:proton antiporter-2 (CPA2) family protein n=1 Tax=Paraglaciecola aquimarina TaxID=1235557 RepID=A0ABU3SU48_9ALTE|nr:monovalent cation:proton antiporter-2 (CPA2) family protein [Paraglaciecola aquimarina]MDU0353533.1 monovalent cation:proton antiporter-2 (CPA2) family protein [Paraglaciecola aquimarina]
MEAFLLQLFIFLAAAAISVPIAKKLGLGSVLGYLIAGIVIGPFGASLIHDVEAIMHFTEFGVVMMLFLVGLELKPSLLWQLRIPILGFGGSQVVLTSLLISSVAFVFLPWQQALAVGLILSLSSTAIVLQTLQEKGLMKTEAGQSVFAVLLFQDLAVIPMLAVLPLLATLTIGDGGHHESALFDLSVLPNYLQIVVTIAAIGAVLVLGKFACQPLFRSIANTGVREIFVAAALGLVIGTSLLMMTVGLSPALGAFLAGVVLADSEFRHELESDIEPFKGLLLGIFFISIGANLNFTLIGDNIPLILGLTATLIAIKWLVLVGVSLVFKISRKERGLFAIALAQGGEFAFVLFQVTKTNGVLSLDVIEPLISAAAISMFLAPLMFLLHEKLSGNAMQSELSKGSQSAEHDTIEQDIQPHEHKVILAGFGRLGTDIGRFLLSAGVKPVILDHNAGNVSVLRKLGFEVYYGDATRLDLLESAGAAHAELLIIALGDMQVTKQLVELANKHYPNLHIVVNASDREANFELRDLGLSNIYQETFGTALNMGQAVMQQLGVDPYEVHRLKLIFQKKENEITPELYQQRGEEQGYISLYRKHHQHLEELMKRDNNEHLAALDKAWTAKNPEL